MYNRIALPGMPLWRRLTEDTETGLRIIENEISEDRVLAQIAIRSTVPAFREAAKRRDPDPAVLGDVWIETLRSSYEPIQTGAFFLSPDGRSGKRRSKILRDIEGLL